MHDPIDIYRKEVTQRILVARSQGGWEGAHSDFKRELGAKSRDHAKLLKHMLAFANTPRRTDAYIIFGVSEDKDRNLFEHIGVSDVGFPSKETIEQITHEYTHLENVFVDSHFLLDGKRTPYVVIPMQYEGPHSVARPLNIGGGTLKPNEIFCRYGSRSVRATPRDVSRMKEDWGSWFLDGRYEKNAISLLNSLKKRFPKHRQLQDLGFCVRLVYDSSFSDEFGSHELPVLVHAYWGFEPVNPDAVEKVLSDQVGPVVRRTIIGPRFDPDTVAAANSVMVQCIPLDEIYFVNDSYAKLCRAFLQQWEKERSDRHLSSIIDLDFRFTGLRSEAPSRNSILTFLEDQLKQGERSAVLVHGDFGCGKTTTAKRLVADMYEEYLRGNSAVPKVLYVNVNNIDIRSRRDECIEGEIARYRLAGDLVKDLVQQVARDEINLIFDGIDEMAKPYTAAGRKDAIQLLRDVVNRRAAVYFIRSSYYPELGEMISNFGALADVDFKTQKSRTVVAQIVGLTQEQVTEYLDSRLGFEDGAAIRSALHRLGLESFLADPLIVSLVCSLFEEEGIGSLQAFPKEGQKAYFLGYLVGELLEREQKKRQRHGGLAEDFKLFQQVLRAVAFSMICRGRPHISNSQLQAFVYRALENVTSQTPEAVDAFRTMAWIHRSQDGELAFRHEALTLVCAAQHVITMFERRDVIGLDDWQSNAPLADVVCQFAGETIRSEAVLGAVEMLSSNLQFNVRQLAKNVLLAASRRMDFEGVPEDELDERTMAGICRGIVSELSLAGLPTRILLKSLGEKASLQLTIVLMWFFSKESPGDFIVPIAVDVIRPRIKRDWNFCDELRTVKERPGTSFDSLLLKDLRISLADLMDSTQYEAIFKTIYSAANIDTPARQYAERTLKGIEGEKLRLRQFRQARGKKY